MPSWRPRAWPQLDAAWLSYRGETIVGAGAPESLHESRQVAVRSLGLLVRAAAEAEALWRSAPTEGQHEIPPHLLTAIARADERPDPMLGLAWATWSGPIGDEVSLRKRLAGESMVAAIRARTSAWIEQVQPLRRDAAVAEILDPLLARLSARLDRSLAASWLWRHMPGGEDPSHVERARERTIGQAQAALLDDPSFREAWEVQRWGRWCEVPRVAKLFPAGLCLDGLARAGVNVSDAAAALLRDEAGPDGYRYYGTWRGIPPDADDLGLALQLLPRIAAPERERLRVALRHPVQLLLDNTEPDGFIPTYLERGLVEPTTDDGPRWLVRRCPAVGINALLGLLASEWPTPPGWLDRALLRTLQVLRDEGLAAVEAYPACYARLLLARLDRALGDRAPAAARSILDELLQGIETELLARQELDGGWGSPLATACHLATLSLRGTPGFHPAAAVRYLCLRQEPDGMWPREALYHCPGRDDVQHDYASRSVTTAVCLGALALVRNT